MEYLLPYLFFVLKIFTITIAITFILVVVLKSKSSKSSTSKHRVVKINNQYEKKRKEIQREILSSKEYKKEQNLLKKRKAKNKAQTKNKNRLFILKFKGDIQASQVESLREQISLILSVATKKDEILICLDSPGGTVNGYGLAASQLERIIDEKIKLTVSIDKVAASGGYLMACVADQILGAPFAMIGSIGVVAQIPNFNRLLKKNNIDVELHTAGNYKRTLTLFGENTKEGREKFKKDLQEIHFLFKDFVLKHRPKLNIKKIATGEVWLGRQSLDVGLIDRVVTSDVYLMEQIKIKDVFLIEHKVKKSIKDRFFKSMSVAIEKGVEKVVFNLSQRYF